MSYCVRAVTGHLLLVGLHLGQLLVLQEVVHLAAGRPVVHPRVELRVVVQLVRQVVGRLVAPHSRRGAGTSGGGPNSNGAPGSGTSGSRVSGSGPAGASGSRAAGTDTSGERDTPGKERLSSATSLPSTRTLAASQLITSSCLRSRSGVLEGCRRLLRVGGVAGAGVSSSIGIGWSICRIPCCLGAPGPWAKP